MGASIIFDDTHWPLLLTRFQGMATNAEYEAYLSRGTAYLQRGEPYVSVLDMVRLTLPTSFQRQSQAEWLSTHEPLLRERMLGCALIITSPFIRLALSAILHIRPMPMPHVVVTDKRSALAWALNRLERASLHEPASRVRQHFGMSVIATPATPEEPQLSGPPRE
jgi:hypothetical protein